MKKLLVMLMTCFIFFSVSACGNTTNGNENDCCRTTEAAAENECCSEETVAAGFPDDIPDCCG